MFRDPRLTKRPRLNFSNTSAVQSMRPGVQALSMSQQGFKIPNPVQIVEKEEEKPNRVFWDEQGRLLDEKGNVINLKQSTELKINQKGQKDSKVKDLLKLKRFGEASSNEILTKRKFFDPSLDSKSTKRDRRKTGAFNFVAEGSFVKRGEILRKKQVLEEYDSKPKEESKEEQIDTSSKPSEKLTAEEQKDKETKIKRMWNLKPLDPIPDVEWWDTTLLPVQGKDGQDPPKKFPIQDIEESDILLEKITHYVQHPVPIKNDYVENINKMVVPIHLTEKEKKKLRRMKRLEKEKDKQEKVKLGLLPTPLPKIKLSNYMKIMGKEAIADPSRVEQKVRKIVEKRVQDHLERNERNKLTRDQKEAKMKRKHERDLQNECRVAVFRVENLTQPHLKFKIDMNAQQYHMGGFCFIADQTMAPDLPNLIVVEGGPRAIKKYKRLMLRRIDWSSKSKQKKNPNGDEEMKDDFHNSNQDKDEDMEDDKIKSSKDKKCFLVWEGIQKKKNFEKWRVVDIRSENEAKRILGEKGCEHFWNMVITFQPERAEGEEPEQLEKLLL